jgi:hypothetical protein
MSHASPSQQSLSVLQMLKGGRHPQIPLVHKPTQQSSSLPQPLPRASHAHVPLSHAPTQQSLSTEQRSPPTPQMQNTSLTSVRPLQQLPAPSMMA